MEYFKISDKYFKRINHYKYRNPPWIKLHNDFLEDYQFSKLSDQEKYHFIAILLLATRSENKIIYDPLWITNKINASSKIDLSGFLDDGFIEKINEVLIKLDNETNKNKGLSGNASDELAECKQDASKVLDQSRVEESRVEESALTRAEGLFNFKTLKLSAKIKQEYYDELKKNYPRINVLQEFGKMNQWYVDKNVNITAASFKNHVRKWMSKTQENPYTKCKQCGEEFLKGTNCRRCEELAKPRVVYA